MLQSDDCGCLVYECIVNGEGAITWSGSAFECKASENQLILFVIDQGTSACNNGAVKAQRSNNTSQLIITDSSLSGSNIKCTYNNGTNSVAVIGNLSVPTTMAYLGRCCCLIQ